MGRGSTSRKMTSHPTILLVAPLARARVLLPALRSISGNIKLEQAANRSAVADFVVVDADLYQRGEPSSCTTIVAALGATLARCDELIAGGADAVLTSVEPDALASVFASARALRARASSEQSGAVLAARDRTVTELSRGVIHDLNNVFCVVQSFAELLLENTPHGDPARRDIQEIANASQRAVVLIDRLVGFSRSSGNRPEPFNVGDHQRRIEPLVRRLLGERYELANVVDTEDLSVTFDPLFFDQLLLDLVGRLRDNVPRGLLTIDATPNHGQVHVRVGIEPHKGSGVIPATVEDVPTALADDQLYRNLRDVVRSRGGSLSIASSPDLAFILAVPAAATQSVTVIAPRARAGERVLIVEDEQSVRLALGRTLRALGYDTVEARLGRDARELIKTEKVNLVITDVVLPDGDGLDLLSELRRKQRAAKGLVVTGYADRELSRLAPDVPLLRKPFTTLDLARKARRALDG